MYENAYIYRGGWGGLLPPMRGPHVSIAHIVKGINVYTVYNVNTVYNVITVHILSLMFTLFTMFTLENVSNAR